jgi:hypothetical protein
MSAMKASLKRMLAMTSLLVVAACSGEGGDAGSGGTAGERGTAGSGGIGGELGAGGEAGAGGELGVGGEAGAGGGAGAGGFGGQGGAGGGAPTLRDVLPSIADEAIEAANAVPGDERGKALTETLAFLRTTCMDASPGLTICLSDLVDEMRLAEQAGDTAYDEAAAAIKPANAAMREVKKRALEAPDPTLVEALRESLREAHRNRTVSVAVTVTRRFDTPFPRDITIYDGDNTYVLIDREDAARINAAASDLSLLNEPYAPAP